MPRIESFIAQGAQVQRQGRVQTSGGTGLAKVGSVLQNIGETLADFRDRDDIVQAQLNFERGMIDIDKKYEKDQDFSTVRERRTLDVKNLISSSMQNLSDRATKELQPELDKALLADEVRFNANSTKLEGVARIAKFEENKNLLMNSYIYAASDSELEAAEKKIGTAIDAIQPWLPADKAANFRNQIFSDARYLRASNQVDARVRAGEMFDPKDFLALDPNQVIRLEGKWNDVKRNVLNESRAYYSERIQDHRIVMQNTGKDSGLAKELLGMGNPQLAEKVAKQDGIDRIVYSAVQQANAENHTGSIVDKYNKAAESLSYGEKDSFAAEKQQALDSLEKAKSAEIKGFKSDPMSFVSSYGVTPVEGESLPEFLRRATLKQKELAGDERFDFKVLNLNYKNELQAKLRVAQADNNGPAVAEVLKDLRAFGPYANNALQELGVSGGMHIALDSTSQNAEIISNIDSLKLSEISTEYNKIENITNILGHPYLKMLESKVSVTNNPNIIKYRNDVVLLAHKWIASGRELDDLFAQYNISIGDNVNAVIGTGIDPDEFSQKATKLLTKTDFSSFVSNDNPHKEDILKKLKEEAYLQNAEEGDERIPKGERGYYVANPMNNDSVLRSQETGLPLLFLENEILSTKTSSIFEQIRYR